MCISSTHRGKKPISIKNDLYKARKTQIFIKYPPLKIYILILHVTKIGSTYKTASSAHNANNYKGTFSQNNH